MNTIMHKVKFRWFNSAINARNCIVLHKYIAMQWFTEWFIKITTQKSLRFSLMVQLKTNFSPPSFPFLDVWDSIYDEIVLKAFARLLNLANGVKKVQNTVKRASFGAGGLRKKSKSRLLKTRRNRFDSIRQNA